MKIYQTREFDKAVKRIFPNQKKCLDEAVSAVADNPLIGQQKKGDLSMVRVYKFRLLNDPMLLAYSCNAEEPSITLLKLGAHENFYRDLRA
ncbi:MAG: type II toxin-antitoxin system RelE/ParE family toxin [Alphaproteobacteria bacterium]